MTGETPTPGETRWRLDDHDRRLGKVEEKADQVPVIKEKIDHLEEGFESVKRALWAVAIALVTATLGVLVASGRFG